ncbi:MAG: pyridoxal-dependent decarboxylase, exosortase A system-associated [Gammaproteobacteria bacterium]
MKKPAAIHAPLKQFPTKDNELVIGGKTVTELAEDVGCTPFYAYDSAAMSRRVAELRAVLPEGVSLHYAMKANPMPEVVRHLATLVDGIDVASAGELEVALTTETPPHEISFAGPGKRDWELLAAIKAGITVNLESPNEMRRLATIGEAEGIKPRVAVRVNPDFELKASGMKMGGGPKAFGIDAEQVPDVLREIGERDLDFVGFHIFSGSQNLRPESIIETQEKTFELAYRLAEDAPQPVTLLNIGGGFGIPYFPGEARLDLEPVSAELAKRLSECRARLPEAEVVIELGRYFVGEAGVYISRVIDRKLSRGEVFLITDGGLHHHLAASGNFGQVVRRNYPVVVANRVESEDKEMVSVCGPLCTPLDVLANKMTLSHAEEGDLIAVLQSGAYGYTASPLGFLSHPKPVEIFL